MANTTATATAEPTVAEQTGLTQELAEQYATVRATMVERTDPYPHVNPNVGAFVRVAINVLSNKYGRSVSQSALALNSESGKAGGKAILKDSKGRAYMPTTFANVAKLHQGNAVRGSYPATWTLLAAALGIDVAFVEAAEKRDAELRAAAKGASK